MCGPKTTATESTRSSATWVLVIPHNACVAIAVRDDKITPAEYTESAGTLCCGAMQLLQQREP